MSIYGRLVKYKCLYVPLISTKCYISFDWSRRKTWLRFYSQLRFLSWISTWAESQLKSQIWDLAKTWDLSSSPCAFWISLSCSPIAKTTHVFLAFAHTCVLLSLYFDDIDNTCAFWIFLSCFPIAKRTHVLLPFSHTYVLLTSNFQKLWHRVMTICLLTEVKRQLLPGLC